jgi:hypothetical protein
MIGLDEHRLSAVGDIFGNLTEASLTQVSPDIWAAANSGVAISLCATKRAALGRRAGTLVLFMH